MVSELNYRTSVCMAGTPEVTCVNGRRFILHSIGIAQARSMPTENGKGTENQINNNI